MNFFAALAFNRLNVLMISSVFVPILFVTYFPKLQDNDSVCIFDFTDHPRRTEDSGSTYVSGGLQQRLTVSPVNRTSLKESAAGIDRFTSR